MANRNKNENIKPLMKFKMKSQFAEHYLFFKTNARKAERFQKIVVIQKPIGGNERTLKSLCKLHSATLNNFHKGTKSKKNQA